MPEVTFLGHSCVTIKDGEHSLIVDPFVSMNPQTTYNASQPSANV